MGERSPFAGTLLLRPLLRETRKTLEQWAVRHGLCWIEDESNQDDAYDRNFYACARFRSCSSAGRIFLRR